MFEEYTDTRPPRESDLSRRRCPSSAVLDILSDKWAALLIARLVDGKLRHGELLHSIDGISQRMLTQTLRTLEQHGLLSRTVFPVVPPHVEYQLTPLGHSLYEAALRPLNLWAIHHIDQLEAARMAFEARQGTATPDPAPMQPDTRRP